MGEPSNASTERIPVNIYAGCAGWAIPAEQASLFAPAEQDGSRAGLRRRSHLERYALSLPAVEINSSFYRPHRRATYERWAASVPDAFRFCVKVPRAITHERRLRDCGEPLSRFLGEVDGLGTKLGALLVQLPPSLRFDEGDATAFFEVVRDRFPGFVVCEPRHADWFHADTVSVLRQFQIGRVAADPPVPVPEAGVPGGWDGIAYYRLHGSPRIYYSEYSEDYLSALSRTLRQAACRQVAGLDGTHGAPAPTPPAVWCVFDNTALGAATANALRLGELLRAE